MPYVWYCWPQARIILSSNSCPYVKQLTEWNLKGSNGVFISYNIYYT